MSRATPLNDERRAYRAAVLPMDEGKTTIHQLFSRGYRRWTDGGEQAADELLQDVERFATGAMKKHVRKSARTEPYVDDPAVLAVLATLSGVVVQRHEKLQDTPPRRLKPIEYIQDLYVNTISSLLREYGDLSLQQGVAETLYSKPGGEGGVIPGRVCTGIKPVPELGDGYYVEVPMAAASRKCILRGEDRSIETIIHENHLYIPARDLDQKYRDYAEKAFGKLLHIQRSSLGDDQLEWLDRRESAITKQLDRIFRSGRTEEIWRDWSPRKRKLRLIRNAIGASDKEGVELGEWLKSADIYQAIEDYDTEKTWEEAVVSQMTGAKGIAQLLARNVNRPAIERKPGVYNYWKVSGYSGNGKKINVSEIEDLFELPCMKAMRDRLNREKPVRKDLYNFARMVMWLPEYHDAHLDNIVEGLKDVFSKWPWYDEAETDYQVRYEFDHGRKSDGGEYLPMSCKNDDMQRYCIGMDECDYSIYGSVPWPDQLYDELDHFGAGSG